MAIVFSTYFDRLDNSEKKKNKIFFTNSGTKTVPTYEYQIIDGIQTLVQNGETDIHELIQSHAQEADIHVIINKFLNGDESVLNQAVGTFGDFTNYPTSYAELFDRVQKCENLFDSLPPEIRSKFDNSYQKFWNEFGSDHFDNVFNEYNEMLKVKTVVDVDNVAKDTDVLNKKGVIDNAD